MRARHSPVYGVAPAELDQPFAFSLDTGSLMTSYKHRLRRKRAKQSSRKKKEKVKAARKRRR